MRIETLKPDMPVHVTSSDQNIELGIGKEASDGGRQVATLSVPQAEMVVHALGLEIAQIQERQRCEAEERAHLAQVVFDTEFRLHEH
jgi:hypothetical protein